MSDLQTFEFAPSGQQVRTVLVDEQPWFVAADVCRALEHSNTSVALRLVDDEDQITISKSDMPNINWTSINPNLTVVNESGVYQLIFSSKAVGAAAFRRWVTHEVLPALRKTGTYTIPGAPTFELPKTMSEALRLAADQFDRAEAEKAARLAAEQRAAALEPSAAAWDHLGRDDGDWSVRDAAKILDRDPAISIGQQRLFTILAELGWTYRDRGDGKWRPYQTAVDAGRLLVLPQSHIHPRTGDVVLDAPQVRVTPKGLAELHHRLGGTKPLAVVEQLALMP